MHYSLIYLLLLFFTLSCKQKKNIDNESDTSFYSKMIKEYKNLLPVCFEDSSYYIIWRFGSIEKAKYISGIALSKKSMSREKTKCYYFSFDYPGSTMQKNVHLLDLFEVSITNNLIIKEYEKQSFAQLDDFIESNTFLGEGRCSNSYIITNQEYFIGIRKKMSPLSKSVSEMFSQISQSEHVQTVSLNIDCEGNDTLVLNILNGQFIYCIEDSVKYW